MGKETAAGVYRQQWRLVYDKEAAVLVDNRVSCIHCWFKVCRGPELQPLATGKLLVFISRLAIHQQPAFTDESQPLCMAAVCEAFAEKIYQSGSISFGANGGCDDTFCHRSMIDAGAACV